MYVCVCVYVSVRARVGVCVCVCELPEHIGKEGQSYSAGACSTFGILHATKLLPKGGNGSRTLDPVPATKFVAFYSDKLCMVPSVISSPYKHNI